MDNRGVLNNLFKLIGIIFILLSMTVFAHSETYNFDCDSTFNCSIKSYCQDNPSASFGLLVHNGTAISNALGTQPINYSFSSNTPGENICSITAKVTAMHSQNQNQEISTFYINGQNIGTTKDNYCNGGAEENCTFCGIDSQNLGQKTITLQENNVLKIVAQDSHAVIAVTLDCIPIYDPNNCSTNGTPRINEISDKKIKYDSEFEIDLWNYVRDDDLLSNLKVSFNQSNPILDCEIINNRYLECDSELVLGKTNISVTATDACNDFVTTDFEVEVYNTKPTINVSDQIKSCSSNLVKFIDLRNNAFDENKLDLNYSITNQSNQNLLNCFVEDDYFLTCEINSCQNDDSVITVQVRDLFGEIDIDTFNMKINDFSPQWSNVNDICIYEDYVLDLTNYVTDLEDGTNLDFEVDQNIFSNIDCEIISGILYCDLKTNAQTSNRLTLRAIDSASNYSDKNIIISTNCSGSNHISFTSNQQSFCLENCASYATQIEITNSTSQTKCFDLELDFDGYLNASLGETEFCLAKNEIKNVSLNVNTCAADHDNYILEVSDYENDLALEFYYEIGSCTNNDLFNFNEKDNIICSGEKREFNVSLRNNTSDNLNLSLDAENQIFLPYFEKNNIYLEENETKDVSLIVNAKTVPGKYSILLGASAQNFHVEKRMIIEVKDCSEIKERNFIIEAPSVCYDVSKGQIFEGSFSVRRVSDKCIDCSFSEKSVKLLLHGMQNELSQSIVSLAGTTEEKIYYTIKVPENAKAGINFLTITGEELKDTVFDKEVGFVDDEQICLNIGGTSNTSISLRTQSKDIYWCDSEIFELEITNAGDFDETFTLSKMNLPKGVSVSFSEQEIIVPKNSSKIIYVSVATSPSSIIGESQSLTIKLNGTEELQAKIYFNILEKGTFADLEILSATNKLIMQSNSFGKYIIQVRNNSELEMTNVSLTFENSPKDINFEEKIFNILPGEIKTIEGKIEVGNINGEFKPSFILQEKKLLNKKEFTLIVNNENSIFTGLFGFTSQNNGLFMGTGLFLIQESSFSIVLSIFLILVLLLIILGIVYSNSQHEQNTEQWVEMK